MKSIEYHILQLDYDKCSIEDVELDAKRLQSIAGEKYLGRYIIKKSSDGVMRGTKYGIGGSEGSWHLSFPDSRLTREHEEALMLISRAHRGFVYYSLLEGDTTIRKSKKGRYGMSPYIVKVSKE